MEKHERTELTVTVFAEDDVIITSEEEPIPSMGKYERFINMDR